MRIVLDTNVYVSALMFGGLPGTVLELALGQAFTTLISPSLLDELQDKLTEKFSVSASDAAFIRMKLESCAVLIVPQVHVEAIDDDPDDNRVLECAVDGHADVIVSGDRHLLNLGSFGGIPVLRVRQFIERLENDQR